MFIKLPIEIKSNLWSHQVEALDFAIDHLNRFDSPCLIRMPTGTGKTRVIACLTMLSNPGSSLVLTPWANLRIQMVENLNHISWMGDIRVPHKHEVVPLFPSTAEYVLQTRKPSILVATFTTLNDLRRDQVDTYNKLANFISLVLVDEGHYEPAVEWGKSVKGLRTRTVLLTATPYRNDLKLFRIKDPEESTYHFTHEKALDHKIIRDVSFYDLESSTDITDLSEAFIQKWKEIKSKQLLPSQSPRAIVCCYNSNDIETVVSRFQNAGLNSIGIHEQFEDYTSSNVFRKNVPDPLKTNVDIWVHQNKLTEGLDDNRFCCIAFFTPIRNDRKMIQQIGRILRCASNDFPYPAAIFSPEAFSIENEWKAYREFETDLYLLEPHHYRDVVENLISSQPKVEYFDKRFRRQFNPSDLSLESQVIIPPSVLVRMVKKTFSLDDYIEDCTDTLNINDAVILGSDINGPCQKTATYALWVYASFKNSRLLHNTSLYEIKLETHCIVIQDNMVILTDSKGYYPYEYLEEHTSILSQEKLTRYLDKSFRPTNVNINSSIPYDTVVRGAALRGHNILNVPASLIDRLHICRSVEGSSKKKGRRYIGLINGRLRKQVTEVDRRNFELKTFLSWTESVARILKLDGSVNPLFSRYMQICPPPENPLPKTICLDLLSQDISISLTDGRECRLKKSSSNISQKKTDVSEQYFCSFYFEGAGIPDQRVDLKIVYNPVKKRFWFYIDKASVIRITHQAEETPSGKNIAEYLNQNQDNIIIGLDGGDIVYQGRNFYKIDYAFAEQVLLNLIQRPSNAPLCKTEKGSKEEIELIKKTKSTTFASASLFKSICERQIELPFEDILLICSDMGSECADFVAANMDQGKLALIHAKAGEGSKISASAFHDVVAQAMKNLVYLTKNGGTPQGVDNWHSEAYWSRTKIPRLCRCPDGFPSKSGIWKLIKSNIINSSDPDLFIILVTTGCCDIHELKKAVHDSQYRTPETGQLLHLLDGLNGYARQLGVKLLIYDLPYSPA
jgi:superfamily II DNA or RNA helicase